jgi:toxin ParE1/3/4
VARAIYAPEAEDDLLAIGAYIARDNPIRARAFIARIEKRVDALSLFPNRGRRRPEIGPEFRSIPVRPVVVFYRVSDTGATVEIVRIVDGRRDFQTLFFRE